MGHLGINCNGALTPFLDTEVQLKAEEFFADSHMHASLSSWSTFLSSPVTPPGRCLAQSTVVLQCSWVPGLPRHSGAHIALSGTRYDARDHGTESACLWSNVL